MTTERIDKPLQQQVGGSHYQECGIQPARYIHANKMGFFEGCIVKRATRYNKPTGKGAEDLKKIAHEALLLLSMEYGEDYTLVPSEAYREAKNATYQGEEIIRTGKLYR